MAARGGGAKSGGALPNLRSFGPKTAIFRPKQPQNPGKTPKRRDTVSTLHVRLHFTVSKSSLVPKKAPKSPKNLRNAHHHPETKHRAYLGLSGSNPNSEGT